MYLPKAYMPLVHVLDFMYRIDHSYEEYMSPYILPVEDIRGHILRVSGVYLTYTTVTHALGVIKCTITELGVYASIYTPSYRP